MADKWTVSGEGKDVTYTKGEIVIKRYPAVAGVLGATPYWAAEHHGQRVNSNSDLQKVMDYCDQFLERLS